MSDFAFINIEKIKAMTSGHPDVVLGLVDGPVMTNHPDLSGRIQVVGTMASTPQPILARRHGTFIAGILAARRDAAVPGICPDCTLLVRALGGISAHENGILSLSQDELAAAIVDCVEHGAHLINLSLSLSPIVRMRTLVVADALRFAAARGVLVIAASGNEADLRDSEITAHPWVIPVTSLAKSGRHSHFGTTSPAIGTFGVSAPGESIESLDERGGHITLSGTSAAAAFVTGTAALLRTLFAHVSPQAFRAAIVPTMGRKRTLYPPAFDGGAAYRRLSQI